MRLKKISLMWHFLVNLDTKNYLYRIKNAFWYRISFAKESLSDEFVLGRVGRISTDLKTDLEFLD